MAGQEVRNVSPYIDLYRNIRLFFSPQYHEDSKERTLQLSVWLRVESRPSSWRVKCLRTSTLILCVVFMFEKMKGQ